jgi:hypothetical protein
LFAATGLGIVLAQIVTSRPIAGFGVLLATRLAASILFSVTLLMVLLALAGALRAPLFAGLMFIFNTSFLGDCPCGKPADRSHREIAGFASSAYGALRRSPPCYWRCLAFRCWLNRWSRAVTMLGVTGVVLFASRRDRPAY